MSDAKPDGMRQRRNQKPKTHLPEVVDHDVPAMPYPEREWHAESENHWHDIWSDPVSSRWSQAETAALAMYIVQVDRLNKAIAAGEDPGYRLTSEIRTIRNELGLSLLGRQRLGLVAAEKPNRRSGNPAIRAAAAAVAAEPFASNSGPQPVFAWPIGMYGNTDPRPRRADGSLARPGDSPAEVNSDGMPIMEQTPPGTYRSFASGRIEPDTKPAPNGRHAPALYPIAHPDDPRRLMGRQS